MKKFLLSMAAVIFGLSAYAETVTFDFATNDYGLVRKSGNDSDGYIADGTEITYGPITITLNSGITTANNFTGWRLWTDGLRAYNKQEPSFKVSTDSEEPITKISFTVVSGATFALEGTTENITSWEGSAEEVSFVYTASSNKALVTLSVTYGGDSENPENPEPDQPTLGPSKDIIDVAEALELIEKGYKSEATVEGYIISITEISMQYGNATYIIADSADDKTGLTIFRGYFIDNAKFTSTDQIQVGGKVVVKGNLTLYGSTPEMNTGNVILSYEAPENGGGEVPSVETYANFKLYMEANPKNGAQVEGPITAIYQNGRYLYLKDNDGYFMLAYGDMTETFENGDQISYVAGNYSPYKNLPEMTNVTFGEITAGTPVAPVEITVAEVAEAQINSYIKLTNVTVNGTDVSDADGNTAVLYKRFTGVEIPEEGVYNVEGFISIYDTTIQIYPTSFTAVEAPAPVADIYISGEFNKGEVENAIWKLHQGDAEDNEDNQYTGYFDIPAGEFSFCFQMGDKYLVPADGGVVTFDDYNSYTGSLVESETPANWTYEAWDGGELAVLLDTDAKTVYFEYVPQLLDSWYVRGAFNNYNPNGSTEWALLPSANEEEFGIYTGTFEVPAGQLSFNIEDPYGYVFIPDDIATVEMEFVDNEYTGYLGSAYDETEEDYVWTYPEWDGGVVVINLDLMEGKITVTIDAKTDAISSIANGNNIETVYNLQGVKINKNQINKGLYIINGKKVMVK